MDQDQLIAMLGKREELHPDLALYLQEDDTFGTSLRHPLVFSILHTKHMNAYVNAQYTYKRKALDEAVKKCKWSQYIWLHERPYRLDAFSNIAWRLEGTTLYWELLGEIWIDSENIFQNRDEWRDVLEQTYDDEQKHWHHMSRPEDRVVFTLTPEKGGLLDHTLIFRGYSDEDGLDGFSWTLDRARAKWFARRRNREGQTPLVAEALVARADVLAYHTGRDEQEIVALPECVVVNKVEEV